MPVDNQHPTYKSFFDRWTRIRNAYDGEDAVKQAGVEYLPKVSAKQRASAYEAYKARASFYDALSRTIDGFAGAVSRKPHTIELPEAMDVFVQDATAEGTSLSEFIKHLCAENALQARAGVLVDYDDDKGRAYLSAYQAESITNWGDDWVVLRETVNEAEGSDHFDIKPINQFRQIWLNDGVYTVTIWREPKRDIAAVGKAQWTVYSETVPTRRGLPLDVLPWVWLSIQGCTSRVSKPPLLGLADLAISHYRTSADLEHGRHYSGLPTLYIAGIADTDEEISVGSTAAILLPDPSAKVGYAQFDGDGLGSLERALEEKEQKMAALGAAILTDSKRGVEAAETARIRTSGENSLLMSVVSSVEEALRTALGIAATWMSAAGAIKVELNRDFVDVTLEPQMLLGLVAAVQAGTMTIESFLYALAQGEMLPPNTDLAAEAAKLTAAKQVADAAALAAKTQRPVAETN